MTHLISFTDRAYIREGECDGCPKNPGACCQFVVLPERTLNEDELKWLRLHHGAENLWLTGVRGKKSIPCSALVDGRCSLYGSPERPEMCGRYPEIPEQLIEGCAYTLASIER